MNIIIPLGGKGERFKNVGYYSPKPLIKIFDKNMISYVLDNLNLTSNDNIFIIYYNLDENILEKNLSSKYNIHYIKIHKQTGGAAETVLLGLNSILKLQLNNKKCILMDCDTFYTQDVISMYRNLDCNAVFYTKNCQTNPIFSYIQLDDNSRVIDIKEKVKISDNANTGIYCFKDIEQLYFYAKYVVTNDIRFKNEYYTSCIIYQMIKEQHNFIGIELNPSYIFNLGTPEQLEYYINNTYIFLFDLDGTLVLSDDIYYNVWRSILNEYKIELTQEIFKNYIQGNSDSTVLRSLLPSKCNELLPIISNLKDELFLENIDKIRVIYGAKEFIHQVRMSGHKIAIVTNCNRNIAETIVKYIDIKVDKIIIGNECSKTKPYPEPYLTALKHFNSSNNKCIIFEDSKTGIQSGKNTFPKCLVGITSVYDKAELARCGVDLSIDNYTNLNINEVLLYNNMNIEKIIGFIKNSILNLNIEKIEVLDHKLKGGFISDVLGIKIETDIETLDCVLKLENKNETFLSKMANELGLYEREYYFYDNISKYVPIKVPEFYGLIKDDSFNNVGILMNNLINLDYKLNLDLNKEKVDIALKVIDRLAQLHSKFWNKNLSTKFKELKKHNDPMFKPKWEHFIQNNWDKFKSKWSNILTKDQLQSAQNIVDNFGSIQSMLSDKNLTLCHGDVKSANIFYKKTGDSYEPYFIDWQYVSEGKGVQDLVFFMIESFDIQMINKYRHLFKDYYYIKLGEYGVNDYELEDYDKDFYNAVRYFPFFVAIWFGTVNEDELIDKNFPFFFIQRLFNFL